MQPGNHESAPTVSTGVSRRQFAAMGAAVAAASYAGSAHAALPVQERRVQVQTRSGTAAAVFYHPAEGTHPGVVLWPDVAGLRANSQAIARELAAAGFAVLMPDPHYRTGGSVNTANLEELHITRDSKDLTAWLGQQEQVKPAPDGYVTRNAAPSRSALLPRAAQPHPHAAYLVSMPRGSAALSQRQLAALDRAIHATDRLAQIEGGSALAA